MDEPLTFEFALEKLKDALRVENHAEIEKWDWQIRKMNEYRIKCKQKDRARREALLRLAYKQSLKIF